MPRIILSTTIAAALATFAISTGSTPADAGIQCQGPNQVLKGGGLRPSLYCEDNHLAAVARKHYRIRVSAAEVRNNLNKKAEICNFIGNDSRVRTACTGLRREDQNGRYPN